MCVHVLHSFVEDALSIYQTTRANNHNQPKGARVRPSKTAPSSTPPKSLGRNKAPARSIVNVISDQQLQKHHPHLSFNTFATYTRQTETPTSAKPNVREVVLPRTYPDPLSSSLKFCSEPASTSSATRSAACAAPPAAPPSTATAACCLADIMAYASIQRRYDVT